MNSFDTSILSFFNQFSQKSQVFDHIVVFLADASLLKAGLLFAIFWYFWFDPRNAEKNRASILATLTASASGILAARGLANLLPLRERPLNVDELHFNLPLGMKAGILEDWSSFPSDHATMFLALVTGIFYLSRRLGLASLVYVLVIVILPRLYLGIHFPTDILAGAVIGISFAWLAHRDFIKGRLGRFGATWVERHPASFYACFFLATYQFVVLFDDLRDLAKIILKAIKISRTGQEWDDD